jgi:hypothetical protein
MAPHVPDRVWAREARNDASSGSQAASSQDAPPGLDGSFGVAGIPYPHMEHPESLQEPDD